MLYYNEYAIVHYTVTYYGTLYKFAAPGKKAVGREARLPQRIANSYKYFYE